MTWKVIRKAWEKSKTDLDSCTRPSHLLQSLLECKDEELFGFLERYLDGSYLTIMNTMRQMVNNIRKENVQVVDIKDYKQLWCSDTDNIIKAADKESDIMGSHRIAPIHLFFAMIDLNSEVNSVFSNLNITYSSITEDYWQELSLGIEQEFFGQENVDSTLVTDNESLVSTNDSKFEIKREYIEFVENVNLKTRHLKKNPSYGRDIQIDRVIQVLQRKEKCNPLIIAEAGVGKTNMVEGLSWLFEHGKNIPIELKNKQIFKLDINALVAGTKYRGDFEKRIKQLFETLILLPDVILFIDEMHTVIGAGNSSNGLDFSNFLKHYTIDSGLKIIGATTFQEYKEIEKNAALNRRFHPIKIEEPNIDDTIEIINNAKSKYEDYHNIVLSKDVVSHMVIKTKKYITGRNNPDLSFDVIDEIGSYISKNRKVDNDLLSLKDRYHKNLVNSVDLDDKAILEFNKVQTTLYNMINKTTDKRNKKLSKNKTPITKDLVNVVLSNMTGLPITIIKESSDTSRYDSVKTAMNKKVKGQKDVVEEIIDSLKIKKLNLINKDKPLSMFFIGSSGVGKTELSKILSSSLFGHTKFLKINMSEYSDKISLTKLIGASAGYVGYEDGGILSNFLDQNNNGVILLDEIEKAHSSIHKLFLEMLDEGIITNGSGKKYYLKNFVIIFTSNVGTKKVDKKVIGFNPIKTKEEIKNVFEKELAEVFPYEFIGRIDNIIYFNTLDKSTIKQIITSKIQAIKKELKSKGINLTVSAKTKNMLVGKSYDTKYGARLIDKVIKEHLIKLIVKSNDKEITI